MESSETVESSEEEKIFEFFDGFWLKKSSVVEFNFQAIFRQILP